MTAELANALKAQCSEQRERCLYSATTLLIWLRMLRKVRIAFVVLPIIFGDRFVSRIEPPRITSCSHSARYFPVVTGTGWEGAPLFSTRTRLIATAARASVGNPPLFC